MSSANNFAFDERPSARSFIYIENRSGPSMEPWGTPTLTSSQEEFCPLRTTLCFLFLKKFDNSFKRLPDETFMKHFTYIKNPYLNSQYENSQIMTQKNTYKGGLRDLPNMPKLWISLKPWKTMN